MAGREPRVRENGRLRAPAVGSGEGMDRQGGKAGFVGGNRGVSFAADTMANSGGEGKRGRARRVKQMPGVAACEGRVRPERTLRWQLQTTGLGREREGGLLNERRDNQTFIFEGVRLLSTRCGSSSSQAPQKSRISSFPFLASGRARPPGECQPARRNRMRCHRNPVAATT